MRLSKKSFIKRQNQALRFEDKPRSSESPRRNQGHQHRPCTGGNASANDTPWVFHVFRARVLAHSSTADPPLNSARSEILISYASRRATPRQMPTMYVKSCLDDQATGCFISSGIPCKFFTLPLTVRHKAMDKSHRHGAFAHR